MATDPLTDFVARGQAAQAAVDRLTGKEDPIVPDDREVLALRLGRRARELHDRAATLTGEANKVRAEAKRLSDRASAILRGEGLTEEEGGQVPLPFEPPPGNGEAPAQAMRIEIEPQGQPTRSLVVLPPGPVMDNRAAGMTADDPGEQFTSEEELHAQERGRAAGETLIQKLRRQDLGVPYHVAGDVPSFEAKGFLMQLAKEVLEASLLGSHVGPKSGPATPPPFRAEVLPIELPDKSVWFVSHARHWTKQGPEQPTGPVTTYQLNNLVKPADWTGTAWANWTAKANAKGHDDAPENLELSGIRAYRKPDSDFDDDGRGQDDFVIGTRVAWCDVVRVRELEHVVPTAAKEAGPTVATDVDPPKWEKWVSKVREILARNKTGVGITTIPPELEGLARQLFAVNNNPIAGANLFDFYAKDWRPLPADLVDAAQVISPGAVIATNYGSHGTVISLSKYGTDKSPEWSLTYVPPHAKQTARGKWKEKDHHFINEIKIVGGRLMHYGRDEIFVLKPVSAETHNAAAAGHHAKLKKEDAGDVVPVAEAMGKSKLTNVRYLREKGGKKKKPAGGVKYRPQSFGQWFGTFKSVYDVEAGRAKKRLPKSDAIREDPRVKDAFAQYPKLRPSDAARKLVAAMVANGEVG